MLSPYLPFTDFKNFIDAPPDYRRLFNGVDTSVTVSSVEHTNIAYMWQQTTVGKWRVKLTNQIFESFAIASGKKLQSTNQTELKNEI